MTLRFPHFLLLFFTVALFFGGASFAFAAAWDISTAAYQNKEFSIVSQAPGSQDVLLNDDGTKMYIFDASAPHIRQYTLSTAWDVSTATYANISTTTSGQNSGGYPRGAAFNSDGTKLYTVSSQGTNEDTVFQYSLGTAWDVSTLSYDNLSYSVATQNDYPVSLTFKPDGTAMYLTKFTGNSTGGVYQYSLGTAWNVSTASYVAVYNTSAQTTSLDDADFSSDGTKMFVKGLSEGKIYQYTLSTPWDVTSASYASKQLNFNATLSAGSVQGMHFRNDGERLYLVSISTDKVYQYALHTDVAVPTVSVTSPTHETSVSGTVTITASATDDTAISGVKFYVNNVLSGSEDTSSPYSISWDSFTVSNGTSTILAVARDPAGNVATSTAISVGVSNSAPSTTATNATIGNISSKTATVSWTSGNGTNRVVFMKANTDTGEAAPVNSTTYTANAVFGSGTQIGSTGWYAVYSGSGSSVSVSNLNYTQSYRVHVVEYNGGVGYQTYQTTAGSGNPANKSAYAGATVYSNYSTGNDTTGSGSLGAPYKTFHKAYTIAVDGDTLNLTGTFSWNNADETGDSSAGYTLSKQLSIVGQKAGDTIVQAHTAANTAASRVFTVSSGYTVSMQSFTVRYGNIANGAACIYSAGGVLTLLRMDIYSCRGTVGDGGAVYTSGTATTTIEYSSIRNSTLTTGSGAGVYLTGATSALIITNSTITGNSTATSSASYVGGGMHVVSGKAWLTNVTVTGNTSYHGGGISNAGGTIYLRNVLSAGNFAESSTNVDLYRSSGTFTSNGYNIFGEYTLAHVATSTADWSDQNGDGTYLLSGGGSGALSLAAAAVDDTYGTYTHALQTGSIGIDHGIASAHSAGGLTVPVPTSDQRVLARSGTTDIGAYEYYSSDSVAPTVSLTLPDDGATIYGSDIGISATSSDDTAVAGVKFYVNNILVGSEDTSSPYAIVWNSLSATTSGSKIIVAVARDASGNAATSSARTVTLANQPAPSSLTASTSPSAATIEWTTLVEGSSRMFFGFVNGLASSTPEANTGTRVTSHSVNLTGLPPCAVYKYYSVSKNEAGEIATSTQSTFKTSGCSGSATITASGEGDVATASGGTLTQDVLSLTIPASFTSTSSTATFQAKKLDGATFFANVTGPSGKTRAGTTVYNLSAYTGVTTALSTFAAPITVTLSYTDSDISGLDESTLKIERYDSSVWSELSSCTVNTSANTVSCTTTAFSDVGIFGDPSSSSSSSSSGGGSPPWCSGPSAPGWNASLPSGGCLLVVATEGVDSPTTPIEPDSEIHNREYPSFTRDLSLGMVGDDVRALQQFLNARGHTIPAGATGYFGQQTQSALAEFQAQNNIAPALGYFGPKTKIFVNSIHTSVVPQASATEPSSLFSRDMWLKDEGADVMALQTLLIEKGYTIRAGATGYFGEQTRETLSAFQKENGIAPASGYFGPVTRAFIALLRQ